MPVEADVLSQRRGPGPRAGRLRRTLAITTLALQAMTAGAAEPAIFFDDFGYASLEALRAGGWLLRDQPGAPGLPGTAWRADAVQLVDDPAQRGNRLLRLAARSDGTPAGTVQAQTCHMRKALYGTYAARVRLSDQPARGTGADPIVQAFIVSGPLAHDFDPEFSRLDWAYRPHGGWGEKPGLAASAWQTLRVEPWQAHRQVQEIVGSQAGWHTLLMQVEDRGAGGRSRWFVDGQEVARHGGRNHPVMPMAIGFRLWFAATTTTTTATTATALPPGAEPRVWLQDVDWVLYAADRLLPPHEVQAEVQRLRTRGIARLDTAPPSQPPLPDRCEF